MLFSFVFGYTNNGDFMFYYFNNFILYSLVGFIYEVILKLIMNGKFSDNPFTGPWVPVYGFGIVLMIVLERFIFNRFKIPRVAKIVMLFLAAFIILTILELTGGMLTEAIFHKSFWDYSKFKLNYGKYICVEISAIWCVFTIVYLYLLKPFSDKIIKRIPKGITLVVLGLMVIDFLVNFVLKYKW